MCDCHGECGEGLDFAEQIVLEAGTLAALGDDHALEGSDDGEDSGQAWCAEAPTVKMSKRILNSGAAGFVLQVVLKAWGEGKKRRGRRHRTEEHRRQFNARRGMYCL